MKNLAKYSVDKAITVFMAVVIVAIFGVVSFTRLTTDLFPSMNIPYAVVVTTYIGASPDEVEEIVSKPLEETFATTANVKNLTSISQENVSIIMLEFQSDANMDSAVIDMRENLDMVLPNLPDEVGNPMIIKINPNLMPVMQFSVSKTGLSQQELTLFVEEEVLPQVERIGGVASVSVSGAYQSEISVILDDAAIQNLNDTIALTGMDFVIDKELITGILQAQNFAFPVGYVNLEGVNYLIRVGDEFSDLEDVKELVLFDLGPVKYTLDDLADITFINASEKEYSKVNGNNAITLTISKSSEFATTDVTKVINETMNGLADTEGLDYTVLLDQGEYIEMATGSVINNLLMGAALAVIVLFVFLRNLKATFIVGIAIPISLLFAIVLIFLSGITLNIVSLGGLALGIGMLVDNSIVVMENIFRLKKKGLSSKEAAIKGTAQVGGAITASTLTTISVFIPIIFIEGFIKEIFIQMALTITFSLLASLLIALTLVPSVSSRIFNDRDNNARESKGLEKMKNVYEKVFKFSFKFKAIILPAVLLLFLGSVLLASTNGFEYFPSSDEGQLSISITNPDNAPLSYDDFVLLLDDVNDEIVLYDSVETVGITLGSSQGMFMNITDTDSATVNVILKDDRSITTAELQNELIELFDEEFSNVEYAISGTQDMVEAFTGSGIQIQLSGYDLDTLKEEATKIANILGTVDGLIEIDNGVGKESDEVKVTVNKDEAIKFGITTVQVLGAVAQKLAGEEVVTQLSMSGDLYEIYVYDKDSNTDETTYSISDIQAFVVGVNMFDPTPETPEPVFVSQVATVELIKGFTTINRENGSRVLTITASFDEGFNSSLVSIEVENALKDGYSLPDGYEYEIQGENEEVMKAFGVLGLAVLLGIILIYMIMASQFQSLIYPFIIMFSIPLAFTGGFLILYFANMPVSVVSLIGLIILTGVVVNNGIVIVDYTNQLRDEGKNIMDALLEAGRTRLRPVIMTALTTILALTTMALAIGKGAEMMQPMAVTTIGGLIYATVMTLVILPIMYFVITKHTQLVLGIVSIVVVAIATIVPIIMFGTLWAIYIGAPIVLGIIALLIFLPNQGADLVE